MFVKKSTKIFTIPSENTISNLNITRPLRPKLFEDTLIRNLKPIIWVSRVFGYAPYSITNSALTLSKINVAYSGLCIILYIYITYERFYLYYYFSNTDRKLKILSIIRTLLTVSCVITDIVICIIWDRKFQNFLNYVKYYDLAVKSEDEKKNSFLTKSWTLLVTNIFCVAFIGILSYFCEIDEVKSSIFYLIIYFALTWSIFKFMNAATIIFIRFRNLNRLLMEGLWKLKF